MTARSSSRIIYELWGILSGRWPAGCDLWRESRNGERIVSSSVSSVLSAGWWTLGNYRDPFSLFFSPDLFSPSLSSRFLPPYHYRPFWWFQSAVGVERGSLDRLENVSFFFILFFPSSFFLLLYAGKTFMLLGFLSLLMCSFWFVLLVLPR